MLSESDQEELLRIARETLATFVRQGKSPNFKVNNAELQRQTGVFVTLRKEEKLRGCLGVIKSAQPLWRCVQEQTIAAVVADPRFPQVTVDELDRIKIEISVLSPLRKINSPQEIELGKHGVLLQQGTYGGTFLPQVATETGWDLETFLGNLCKHKAGLPQDCWQSPNTVLYIFEAQVFGEK